MRVQIPHELLNALKLESFIAWLLVLQVERKVDRKIIVCEWCRITGYPLTPELVKRVYTEP